MQPGAGAALAALARHLDGEGGADEALLGERVEEPLRRPPQREGDLIDAVERRLEVDAPGAVGGLHPALHPTGIEPRRDAVRGPPLRPPPVPHPRRAPRPAPPAPAHAPP